MYVSVQFIILEILLGLIFLVVLYFMLKGLLKKMIRRELRDVKEPLQVLANYLVAGQQEGPEDPNQPGGGAMGSNEMESLPDASPEKLPEEPVDIADEFNQLKNTNRITAYNIRVQKIWDLYKLKKITLRQYRAELLRLKKEFNIPYRQEENDEKRNDLLKPVHPIGQPRVTKLAPSAPGKSADKPDRDHPPTNEPNREDKAASLNKRN